MTPEQLAVIGTLAGALIGSLSTLAITWINKRFEERRQNKELIVKAALENWKVQFEAKKLAGGRLLSLDFFLIHSMKMAELLNKKQLTPADLDHIYNESEILQGHMFERARQKKEKSHQRELEADE